ncbi:hypothetical protein AAZX31_06G095500 [Glycine max]|uniref:RING-type E3 ubiquitin transferase n=2 Tax=Glycine subgen. Soja TaxID=1462606 RepID=K7KU89_SOYBN|nr:RING-H2 finger protein ATL11 [Glycine max]XP_028235705.1 RING-H2 finger protein ATL11-like [Glycine soja]KAG5045472.1 hypothetical protein JHK86_014878 [Glycine max]KAH1125096.1 hypothetical protein GYH30_014625 [Glycine max]KAH1245195.1 RING-H2 finger protein ATL11 [Glycine max]KRH52998.1 hypothetical protein GLYMA_06G099800v4 [Glycine max]RZC06722.1 RING-H2 finger protein ATL11 [Glycine soja]|eukprot:XP_003527893.1 RING-H2 finger protein ATL11 [Glycine max]
MTTLTHSNFHHDLLLLFYFFLLTEFPSPLTAQLPDTLTPPSPQQQEDRFARLKFDKSMAIVLVILVAVFFVLGFLSVYTRQCAERRMRGRFDISISISRRQRGLDREIIETFPTFVYSTVKSLKLGRATLECAVCLNEFEEVETLRFIPNCSHVFHSECIDAWLANHSTCPVCRANLFPKPDDPSFDPIQIPDPEQPVISSPTRAETGGSNPRSPNLIDQNPTSRSRSTGFRIAGWFPRSHSTGHSLVQPGENCERFTLHLPEEVRNQLMLSRTKSCGVGVTFTRENSERRGYRARSVGSSLSPHVRGWFSVKDDVGERSSDRLFSTSTRDSEV